MKKITLYGRKYRRLAFISIEKCTRKEYDKSNFLRENEFSTFEDIKILFV